MLKIDGKPRKIAPFRRVSQRKALVGERSTRKLLLHRTIYSKPATFWLLHRRNEKCLRTTFIMSRIWRCELSSRRAGGWLT